MRDDFDQTVRRQFSSTAAMAALSAAIVPSRVVGQDAPSHKLNLAAIGIGGMGASNLKACADENIVALCDVDRGYAAKGIAAYPKAKLVDYREMLEKETGINSVIIATPPTTHHRNHDGRAQGRQARALSEAADAHSLRGPRGHRGRPQAQGRRPMGNQGQSSDSMRLLKEWLDDRAIGDVTEVHAWTDRPWVATRGRLRSGHGRRTRRRYLRRSTGTGGWGRSPTSRTAESPDEVARVAGLRHRCARRHEDIILDIPLWALELGPPSTVEATSTLRAGRGFRDLSARMHRPLHVPGARRPAC